MFKYKNGLLLLISMIFACYMYLHQYIHVHVRMAPVVHRRVMTYINPYNTTERHYVKTVCFLVDYILESS